jgi:hypothetical protein
VWVESRRSTQASTAASSWSLGKHPQEPRHFTVFPFADDLLTPDEETRFLQQSEVSGRIKVAEEHHRAVHGINVETESGPSGTMVRVGIVRAGNLG